MIDYLCHDFKTPRTDTSRRLPSSFRAIPVIFYVALVGSAYVMTMDYFNYKKALTQKTEAEERRKLSESQRDTFKAVKADLDSEAFKAEKVAEWMEGARNIQPIAVKIARAVQAEIIDPALADARACFSPSSPSGTVDAALIWSITPGATAVRWELAPQHKGSAWTDAEQACVRTQLAAQRLTEPVGVIVRIRVRERHADGHS